MSRKRLHQMRKLQKFMLFNESIRKEYEQRFCLQTQGERQVEYPSRLPPKGYF